YAIVRPILGPIYWQPFYAFFIIGYLTYDYIHYSVHHFRPRTAVGKRLKQLHMNHHFVSHEALWGVSSPLWDVIFRTMHEKKSH
ncbi:MAG: sterol desaturase family protein, partial [Bdellovibrionota bacterium]